MRGPLFCALVVLAFLVPSVAAAQSCSWSVSGVAFGSVNTLSSSAVDITGTVNISCSGAANQTIQLCPNIGVGTGGLTESNRQMVSGANALTYQLYSTTWGGTIWGSDLITPNPPAPPTLTLTLSAAGIGSLSRTLYGRLFAGQSTVPPGSYQSSFSAAQAQLCYRLGGNCHSSCPNTANATFVVSATVSSNCLVSATILNFGSHGLLGANVDATNAISVTCTNGTPWIVSLNAGSGAGGTVLLRKMTGPGAATIGYTIYRDAARAQVWGDGTLGTFTLAGTGTGNSQAATGYGRVPSQTTPAPATYTDTMVVTVTY